MNYADKKTVWNLKNTTKCSVDGCEENTGYGRKIYCEKHYMRLIRHGTTEKAKPKDHYIHSGGYVVLRCPEHPLSKKRGAATEYEHRVVFYNKHGEGPFKCHWCGMPLSWDDKEMTIDHLNSIRNDNSAENLVPSCGRCNSKRGEGKMAITMRKRGRIIKAQGESMCLGEWARRLGVSRASLNWRIKRWGEDKAISVAPRANKTRANKVNRASLCWGEQGGHQLSDN